MIIVELPLHAIAENNLLPNSCAKASATRKGVKKLAIESHDFIMTEILRREALEDVDSADNTDGSGVSCTSSSSSSSASENRSSSDSE